VGIGLEASDVKRVSGAAVFLPAVVVFAAVATVWFALNQQAPRGPLALGWVAPPVTLALATMALRRTAMETGLPAAARRFWNQISATGALCALGSAIQGAHAVTGVGPDATKVPPAAGVCFVGATLYALWALLRAPVGTRTRGEWVRLSLDCATVVLGAAVFLWYVGFGPLVAAGGVRAIWASVVVGIICLVAVAAICKVILGAGGPVDPGALRLLGFGLLVGAK
jgi:hypothetical protein